MKPVTKGILIGCGGMGILFVILIAVCAGLVMSTPESGVKLPYEMDQYATDFLAEHKLLEEGEELVAYYDETLSMDGTESVILTSRRIIRHSQGNTVSIPYTEIEKIQDQHNGPLGVEFTVRSKSGTSIHVEIAPLNGGDMFRSELDNRWAEAKGTVQAK